MLEGEGVGIQASAPPVCSGTKVAFRTPGQPNYDPHPEHSGAGGVRVQRLVSDGGGRWDGGGGRKW